ncbi:MAG: zinc ribbon domain-containing protein [Candidatus Thorarchaeota archaeon]
MSVKKKNFWVPPVIGGVLSLIALATPATYISQMGEYLYVWMWGLASFKLYDPYYYEYITDSSFTDNPSFLIPSIICTIVVFIGAVALLGSTNANRKGVKEVQEVKNTWYGLSTLLIIATAGWMIAYEIVSQVETDMSWWDFMDPGFGVIGIFLGAVISIVGTAVSSHMEKRELRVSLPYKQLPMEKLDLQPTQPLLATTPKFCPMCGNKVENETFKFCTNCGFKFFG